LRWITGKNSINKTLNEPKQNNSQLHTTISLFIFITSINLTNKTIFKTTGVQSAVFILLTPTFKNYLEATSLLDK
jgi:hypothetical protein